MPSPSSGAATCGSWAYPAACVITNQLPEAGPPKEWASWTWPGRESAGDLASRRGHKDLGCGSGGLEGCVGSGVKENIQDAVQQGSSASSRTSRLCSAALPQTQGTRSLRRAPRKPCSLASLAS